MRRELDIRTDEAGALRVPGLPAHRPVHVVLEWDEDESLLGYPPGWFDCVVGSIKDDDFVRPAQGQLKSRQDFD